MRADPNLIRVYDEYGREVFIDKERWRKDVLPGMIKDNWNKPDDLYGIIVGTLYDGFHKDVIKAAKHLYEIDPIRDRASCVLSIVLMKNGKLDEAEQVLRNYISSYGEEGVILTNLAKIQAERGHEDMAEKTLWHALELDPNQDNAVEWWAAIFHERNGKAGYIEALEKVAALDGSWRAQLWLARVSLEKQEYEKARQYYNTIFRRLPVPPSDVMMQISGDLGKAGRLHDLVELCGQRFDPELHGLMVGNNLMKAYIELKDTESARTILNSLYSLNRPEWREHLQFWEDQIDRASEIYGCSGKKIETPVTTLSLNCPVWAHGLASFEKLLPVKKDDAPGIAFISCSCEFPNMPEEAYRQKTGKEGSLSRTIPLFLAEQVHMLSSAKTIMLVPVITGEGSFVLSGEPWDRDALVGMASDCKADFILDGHLIAYGNKWQYHGTFIDVHRNAVLEEFSVRIAAKNPGKDVPRITEHVRGIINNHCTLEKEVAPIDYQLPKGKLFGAYLDGISQSLALTVATAGEFGNNALYGERSILDYLLHLALSDTNSDVTRLMFISALAKNKAYGSSIYLEYHKKASKLLKDYPLHGIANEVCQETFKLLYSKVNKEKQAPQ